jgi:hypothetical protein
MLLHLTPEQRARAEALIAEWNALPPNSTAVAPVEYMHGESLQAYLERARLHWTMRDTLLRDALKRMV